LQLVSRRWPSPAAPASQLQAVSFRRNCPREHPRQRLLPRSSQSTSLFWRAKLRARMPQPRCKIRRRDWIKASVSTESGERGLL
jgi:hypothetical protein